MRLYLELSRRSFQQTLTYRGASIAGVFTNGFFGIMIASIYLGLYASQADGDATVAGWSARQAVTLIWINQSLLMTVYMWGWWEVVRSIQNGSIANDLLKPMDYASYWLARDLGRALSHFLIRGVPTFAVGAILYDLLAPVDLLHAIAFGLSIPLAVTASFGFRFLLNCAGFWVLDYRGINAVAIATLNLLSGFLVPLAFFPSPIRLVAEVLPFRAIIMIPSEIYLGQISPWFGLGYQLFWVAILIGAGHIALALGERKVVIQGG